MNSATFRFLTMTAVFSLLSIGLLQGQTAVTGGIEGNVIDSSGAAIAGARASAAAAADAGAARQSAGAVARRAGGRDRGADRLLFFHRESDTAVGAGG